MFPVRLIYASTLSRHCGPDDVQNILEASRAYNTKNDGKHSFLIEKGLNGIILCVRF